MLQVKKKEEVLFEEGGKGGQGALTRWQSLICRSMRWHTRFSSPSSSPLFPVACADARWSWKMLIPFGWFSSFLYLIAVFADCPVNCVFFFFFFERKMSFISFSMKLYFFSCYICMKPSKWLQLKDLPPHTNKAVNICGGTSDAFYRELTDFSVIND